MYCKEKDMDINRNNYENYFLLYLDRELDFMDREHVEKFLEDNTDLQKEFALLESTVFSATDTVFEPKTLLYRKEEKRRVIPLYWTRIAAVGVGLILGAWFILFQKQPFSPQPVAVHPDAVHRTAETGKNKLHQDALQKNEKGMPEDNPAEQVLLPSAVVKTEKKKERILKNQRLVKPGEKKLDGNPLTAAAQQDLGLEASTDPLHLSRAVVILQSRNVGLAAETKGLGQMPGVKPAALTLSGSAMEDSRRYEKAATESDDTTNDNAISVIALNNQNRGIGGFLKKLAGRESEGEDTKKVRVSVFQISY
jgi:hypothetical protein